MSAARRCALQLDDSKGCTKPKRGHEPSLLLWGDEWYCRAHLPRDAKKAMQRSCTHSLGFGLGECAFCGAKPAGWKGD